MNESIYTAIKARQKQEEEEKNNKGKPKVNTRMPDKWKKQKAPTINFDEIPIW